MWDPYAPIPHVLPTFPITCSLAFSLWVRNRSFLPHWCLYQIDACCCSRLLISSLLTPCMANPSHLSCLSLYITSSKNSSTTTVYKQVFSRGTISPTCFLHSIYHKVHASWIFPCCPFSLVNCKLHHGNKYVCFTYQSIWLTESLPYGGYSAYISRTTYWLTGWMNKCLPLVLRASCS